MECMCVCDFALEEDKLQHVLHKRKLALDR